MTGRFSDSSGWWVAALTLVGVGTLVVLVSSIESGMGGAERDPFMQEAARVANARQQAGWSDAEGHSLSEAESLEEEILESDSLEEQIRKKFGQASRSLASSHTAESFGFSRAGSQSGWRCRCTGAVFAAAVHHNGATSERADIHSL
jgi:hypothetical protein